MKIKLKANAKINISLNVIGRLPDGYHEIETIMQSVGLFDVVVVETNLDNNIIISTNNNKLNNEQNNLAKKAAMLYFEKTGITQGINIYIEKNIPLAAGLGGGSADAAAVLIGLNNLHANLLPDEELQKLAKKIGADVPFFLTGGTMLAKGMGDRLYSIKNIPNCYVLLTKSCEKISTAQMYNEIDSCRITVRPQTEKIIKGFENSDLNTICRKAYNVFEAVWTEKSVLLAKEQMLANNAKCSVLSGAGPTVFGIFDNLNFCKKCRDVFLSNNVWVKIVKPIQRAIEIIETTE